MDDDLGFADRCVGKLASFRVKELKDVLTQLQLSKQGKKQDLMDRIISLLYGEETPGTRLPNKNVSAKKAIASVIDDVYRKMEKTEASGLATIDEGGIDIGAIMPKEEGADVFISDGPVRCPCGSLATTEFMIQCVDPDCQVQQHVNCVIIVENPTDTVPSLPPKFYCELCRTRQADPFWEPLAQLLYPVKLPNADIQTEGSNTMKFVEKMFQLTISDREYLQQTSCEVQAWCILLNDSVPFRMQWPQYANLEVNGMAVRTVNRPGSQLLGANGRDDGAPIKLHIKEGVNKISLSACDSRDFCFGLRLVRRRTIQEVLNMIPKEADGEYFEDALARIRRCTGGGIATTNEDSDSDLEIIAESIVVNLRCPLSGSRIKTAGRFKPCVHMGCFDLKTFVELSQRSRKWQCPICLKNYSVEDIIIDPYFNRITTMMQHCGEDITEIDLKPDGSWSARTNGESSNLAQWHLPDGSISATGTVIPNSEFSKQVGQASHAITMSNGASGSCGDVEDLSTNQGCSGQIDTSASDGNEIDSIPRHFVPSFGISNRNLAPLGDTDIIFLSDSEDESVPLVCSNTICPTSHVNGNDLGLTRDTGLSSSLDLLNSTGNDASLSQWPYPSGAHSSSGLQLFGTDSDITDAFTELEHASVACSEQMKGYTLAPMPTANSVGQGLDSSVDHTNTDYMDEGLISNSIPLVGDDQYLRRFLPTEPATVAAQSNLQYQPSVSNVMDRTDWISLRVGNNGDNVKRDADPHPDYTSTSNEDMKGAAGPNRTTPRSAIHAYVSLDSD